MNQPIPYDLHQKYALPEYSSLAALIETTCSTFPEKIAFSCLGQELTFADVESHSRAFTAYLYQLGTWRKNIYQFYRHSCERRSPESLVNLGTSRWIPAFAGMTN
ncbi:hypothetical protein D5R81_02930 [Parashewanella spongiae]|uniref:AMP-dependent synthetase/ligase domain-containing protein n=1 Tax=Parashewanella spongiae TaxID=342950 RepID=A0A3A6UIU2_9GAMM|nr:hypothetical protein [Parashewanella spongiae]MCL1077371.1 hypothetical protein [Parashewanella spongiae]RJY19003.1 hypothetical protein D5R81_02930 [Parashewanella spongiae]